jgi:hypothetical protein
MVLDSSTTTESANINTEEQIFTLAWVQSNAGKGVEMKSLS